MIDSVKSFDWSMKMIQLKWLVNENDSVKSFDLYQHKYYQFFEFTSCLKCRQCCAKLCHFYFMSFVLFLYYVIYVLKVMSPFKRQSHKMVKHTQTIHRKFADKLFECFWPFCEFAIKGLKYDIFPYPD